MADKANPTADNSHATMKVENIILLDLKLESLEEDRMQEAYLPELDFESQSLHTTLTMMRRKIQVDLFRHNFCVNVMYSRSTCGVIGGGARGGSGEQTGPPRRNEAKVPMLVSCAELSVNGFPG